MPRCVSECRRYVCMRWRGEGRTDEQKERKAYGGNRKFHDRRKREKKEGRLEFTYEFRRRSSSHAPDPSQSQARQRRTHRVGDGRHTHPPQSSTSFNLVRWLFFFFLSLRYLGVFPASYRALHVRTAPCTQDQAELQRPFAACSLQSAWRPATVSSPNRAPGPQPWACVDCYLEIGPANSGLESLLRGTAWEAVCKGRVKGKGPHW